MSFSLSSFETLVKNSFKLVLRELTEESLCATVDVGV